MRYIHSGGGTGATGAQGSQGPEGPAGPTGPQGPPGPGGVSNISIEAGEDIAIGQIVYLDKSNGTVRLASNGAFPQGDVLGMAGTAALSGAFVEVVIQGVVEQSDWFIVTGSTTLVVGCR